MLQRRDRALRELTSDEARARAEQHVSRLVAELERERDLSRTILHCDMDMFYAAVELQRRPELAGACFAVGHGVLLTASYEARQFGVRSAMAEFVARAICPNLIVVPAHMDVYKRSSEAVMAVLAKYDAQLYQRSLDEAYLDITAYCAEHGHAHPRDVAAQLRADVLAATGLTVSVGIAPNRLLAKIASDRCKPNGLWYVAPTRQDALAFMHDLSVRKVPGIGQVMERMLQAMSIHTCHDLWERRIELSLCIDSYRMLLASALGIGDAHVTLPARTARRSVGRELTFAPTSDPTHLHAKLRATCEQLERDLATLEYRGRTVSLVGKHDTFERFTRARACPQGVSCFDDLYGVVHALLEQERASFPVPLCLRLIGVRVSSLIDLQVARNGVLAQWLRMPAAAREAASLEPADAASSPTRSSSTSLPLVKVPTSASASTLPPTPCIPAIVRCPVCGCKVNLRGQPRHARINEHIDACLQQGQAQQQPLSPVQPRPRPRPRPQPQPRPHARQPSRRRRPSPASMTLDVYFGRT